MLFVECTEVRLTIVRNVLIVEEVIHPGGSVAKETDSDSVDRANADDEEWLRSLAPITRSLVGIARGDVGEEDYKEYLWRKYGP